MRRGTWKLQHSDEVAYQQRRTLIFHSMLGRLAIYSAVNSRSLTTLAKYIERQTPTAVPIFPSWRQKTKRHIPISQQGVPLSVSIEHLQFQNDFPIAPSIYKGPSLATIDNQRVLQPFQNYHGPTKDLAFPMASGIWEMMYLKAPAPMSAHPITQSLFRKNTLDFRLLGHQDKNTDRESQGYLDIHWISGQDE